MSPYRTFALIAVFFLAACQFRPSYPTKDIAGALKKMCMDNYKLSVEARHVGDSLQAFFWKVGILQPGGAELNPEAAKAFEKVLLSATRISLSSDAPLKFLEIKMSDRLTGATVSLCRFVPDIKDSMYTRFSEEEYFNRLLLEVGHPKPRAESEEAWSEADWDPPMTMPMFLTKQVVSRLKRQGPTGLQAHEDVSHPQTLGVVLDNWDEIEKQGEDQGKDLTELMEKTARNVVKGYRYTGFREFVLKNNQGLALKQGFF